MVVEESGSHKVELGEARGPYTALQCTASYHRGAWIKGNGSFIGKRLTALPFPVLMGISCGAPESEQ
jgi:hypothetical protein